MFGLVFIHSFKIIVNYSYNPGNFIIKTLWQEKLCSICVYVWLTIDNIITILKSSQKIFSKMCERLCKNSPLHRSYSLCREILKEVPDEKNLGIQIDSKLAFYKHISMVSVKGNFNLRFLMRKIKNKRHCILFSRSALEYSCSVWSQFKNIDGTRLEKVQWRAARFVTGKYKCTDNVSEMNERPFIPTHICEHTVKELPWSVMLITGFTCVTNRMYAYV